MKKGRSCEPPRCSFCHEKQQVVRKLISSPSDYSPAWICDESVLVCPSILDEETPSNTSAKEGSQSGLAGDLHALLDCIPDDQLPAVHKLLTALDGRRHMLSL